VDAPDRVNELLRQLPAVERLIEAAGEHGEFERWSLLAASRRVLVELRRELREAERAGPPDLEALAARTRRLAAEIERPWPRPVLNATGVVLHTNLGRAPLPEGAAQAMARAAGGYTDLELDLETGERGSRMTRIGELLRLASGAEAGLVLNNNAGALLLAVDTLACGREVVVSRGELVEIGGSFRVPDIMASSRARLREVGTTNRTHLRDYAEAIGPETGMLLKVHRSNFELRGFTSEVGLRELAGLGREHGIPVVEDRGSGTFLDLRAHGIPEAPAAAGLDEGADLVLFSGDKLLGSVQAGIALGAREPIEHMKRSPLARALRVDKLCLAALDWTLRSFLAGRAGADIPVLRMLLASPEALAARAERLAEGLRALPLGRVSVERTASVVGGGALPELRLAGVVVRLRPERSAQAIQAQLRRGDPPLLVRVHKDALLLDPRTLETDREIAATLAALAQCVEPSGRVG
jgi:L-seryl-tRNA(Ser) seleniumtransferase